jgi:hypothetical protein
LTKVDKKINIVAARGFFTDKNRLLRESTKFADESFKSVGVHREFFFKDDFLWGVDSTGRETFFGDINTDKNFKIAHMGTSNLSNKAEKGICLPILHDDEGYKAQPTYHDLGREATNSRKDLKVQVKWSCPSLPASYLGKTHTYKVYNKNYS